MNAGQHSARSDVIADALERHNTLGARCTCGASLPPERLDTPRWFAEHLADVVRDDRRPLVVIDPENRAQVERLVVAHCRAYCCDPAPLQPEEVAIMQAALREFANPQPPKPEEPTGLGAVVEDADGDFHVYSGVRDVADDQRWWVHGVFRRKYADIDVVRVLSEGVQ